MPEATPAPDVMPQGHIPIEEMARNGFDISMCPFLAQLAMQDPEAAKAIMDSTLPNVAERAQETTNSANTETAWRTEPQKHLPKKEAISPQVVAPFEHEFIKRQIEAAQKVQQVQAEQAAMPKIEDTKVQASEQAEPKRKVEKPTNVAEKALSQVEQAMRHMKELDEKMKVPKAPAVKPMVNANKKSPSRPELRVAATERRSSGHVKKTASLPDKPPKLAAVKHREIAEPSIIVHQEATEYAALKKPAHTFELPMVAEPEVGLEPNYEALFQEMVAEFGAPTADGEVATEPDVVWPQGLFELDSIDELVVEVRERAEAQALELPEVVPQVAELDAEPLIVEEAMPLPAILQAVSAANEVLEVAEPAYDETEGILSATIISTEQDEVTRTFMPSPELSEAVAAGETKELDYQDPESLLVKMREFMWLPGTSDFAANNGSVGHRLGRLLLQLITGRIDSPPAFAAA